MIEVEIAGIYRDLCDSFVVNLSRANNQKLFIVNQLNRKNEYGTSTYLIKDRQKTLQMYKEALSSSSYKHISNMKVTYDLMTSRTRINMSRCNTIKPGIVSFEYIYGQSLERKFLSLVLKNGLQEQVIYLNKFIELAQSIHEFHYRDKSKAFSLIDLNFDNIIIRNNDFVLIDYEWTTSELLHVDVVVKRALYFFFLRYTKTILSKLPSYDLFEFSPGVYCPKQLYTIFSEYFKDYETMLLKENEFQSKVLKKFSGFGHRTSH